MTPIEVTCRYGIIILRGSLNRVEINLEKLRVS